MEAITHKGTVGSSGGQEATIFDSENSSLEDDQLLDILNNACSS